MRRHFSIPVRLLLVGLFAIGAFLAPATTVLAQDDPTTTEAPPAPNIIPEPNSGSEPQEAGDRGGALQTILFVLIIGAIVAIGAMIVRQSRKVRQERGF